LNSPDIVLYVAKPLANLYTRIGDIEKSIVLHQYAIAKSSETGDKNNLPSLYNNLAIAYQQYGDADSVISTCHQGISLLKEESFIAALLYNNLANAYLESNEPNKASYYSKKSLKLFKEAS